MARPKKDGKRATGIQGKSGRLYIVITQNTIKDGFKKAEKKWVATGLADTPDNVKKVAEIRKKLLNNKEALTADRNVTVAEYTDLFLNRKKREISDTTYSSYYYKSKRIKEYFGTI